MVKEIDKIVGFEQEILRGLRKICPNSTTYDVHSFVY